MAAPLGQNLFIDAGFDNPPDWTLVQADDGLAEIVGSQLHLVSGPLAGVAQASQTPAVPIVIGQQYIWSARVQILSGLLGLDIGGFPDNQFSKDGIITFGFTATDTAQPVMKRATANFEAFIDWVSVRKVNFDMSSLIMEFRDFDGDKKQFSIEMGDVTDGATYTTVSGEATALANAIAAVCAGNISNQQFVATETEPDDTDATDFLAQAHIRWIIVYKDATTGGGPYQIAIPTPDLGDNTLVLAGSNHYDPANAEWITLIAAMEGGEVKNPRTGNNIVVQDIFLEE